MTRDPDRYFEAPRYYTPREGDRPVFTAGGITDCPPWQGYATDRLLAAGAVVLNPSRANFPIHDPSAGKQQVWWEQHHLLYPGVITMMWFPKPLAMTTVQPVATLELGQAMNGRATDGSPRRLLVGADPGYPRVRDVHLMLGYNRPDLVVHDSLDGLLDATIAVVRGDLDA